MSIDLLAPYALGPLTLTNRIVMAPLTRSRAGAGDVAGPMNAEYYAQRATAGLIISEATQVSQQGKGYVKTPGIYAPEQQAGWRLVTDAVHAHGGKIFAQLFHVGRISHPSLQPGGTLPVAPSAIRPKGQSFTENGFEDMVEPRALQTAEIPGIVADYAHAAGVAKAAGFDGIEVHAANGYLLDQFLRDRTNHRTDRYGGPVENRARLTLEVVDAVLGVWERGRVGIRLSPLSTFGDIADSDPKTLFSYVAEQLGRRELAYLHVIEGETGGDRHPAGGFDLDMLHPLFKRGGGAIIANNGYDLALAQRRADAGEIDLACFGRPFIANPDLVDRLRTGAALAKPDPATMYGGDAHGYTDYPALAVERARSAQPAGPAAT